MRHKSDLLLIILFCGAISVFAVGFWLAPQQQISTAENRTLARLPKLRWKTIAEYPHEFEAFYNDHMLCKTFLVRLRTLAKLVVCGTATSPDVAVGRDGWLYLANDEMQPIIRRESSFSQQELKLWCSNLRERARLLAQHGIKYLFVLVPDKHSIYPEFLPPSLRPAARESKIVQLSAFLRQRKDVPFLSLRETLLANKGAAPLYYKTDTHWNDLGALAGYNDMARALGTTFRQIGPLSPAELQIAKANFQTGDCTKLLGVEGCISEVVPAIAVKHRTSGAGCKVVLIHDSFGDFLYRFLRQRLTTVEDWHETEPDLDISRIIAAKPDVVIEEVVERKVCSVVHDNWRSWVVQTVRQHDKNAPVSRLCIMPDTTGICVTGFNALKQPAGKPLVQASTIRAFNPEGDYVRFSPEAISYCNWVLLKDGNQGRKFADSTSAAEYEKALAFVKRNCELVSTLDLSDGSKLALYHDRAAMNPRAVASTVSDVHL